MPTAPALRRPSISSKSENGNIAESYYQTKPAEHKFAHNFPWPVINIGQQLIVDVQRDECTAALIAPSIYSFAHLLFDCFISRRKLL